ncbi:aminodeoxychorismate/anthranilate synthase component II [Cytophagaceae bacterium ABcell3]|nr:aminodeoxychorismate/anthranilate synthase component II [Cytophagaceae bacterium ABcell3]
MILLIDNFDSFTHNLKDYLLQAGAEVKVCRNTTRPEEIESRISQYKGVVISPGPGKPNDAGYLMDYLNLLMPRLPILGICLGHQAISQYFGATLSHAIKPMHGKLSEIFCEKDPLFVNIPRNFKVVRYHSLIVSSLSSHIKVLARAGKEVMAIKHKSLPVYGIQFHPEAVMTEYGKEILKNWLTITQNLELCE